MKNAVEKSKIEIRICTGCGKPMNKVAFYKINYGDGLRRECKECIKERSKLRYRREKEAIIIRQREKRREDGGTHNFIEALDNFLSFHGIDLLKIVRERNEKIKCQE